MNLDALRNRIRRLATHGALYAALLGFAAGLLVAALVVPERAVVTSVAGGGGGESGDTFAGDRPGEELAGEAAEFGLPGRTGGSGGAAGARTRTGRGGAQAGGSSAGDSGSGGTGAQGSGNMRGVSADRVRLGVAVPDYDALRALGENYDTGDPKVMWEAVLDGWKRQGLVPVHGRDVELVFSRPYNIFSDPDKRAACIELVQDKQSFAVGATALFQAGYECVAREYRTPAVGTDGTTEDMMQRSRPYLFTVQMTSSQIYRNWIHWAHARGALRGKTIGLYYPGDARTREDVEKNVKAVLDRLGYHIEVEVVASGQGGGAEDSVAVQQFESAGVDLALLLTAPIWRSNFLRQAETQGYRPTYIDNDLNFATGDSATSTYPPEQWDKTYAMTGLRAGETNHPQHVWDCVRNYERYTGDNVNDPAKGGGTAKWTNVTYVCDAANVLLAGLQGAGRGLTHDSMVVGLEKIAGMPMARHADVTFTHRKHTGADRQRTIQWHASCRCWRAAGDWGALYVQ